MASLDRFSFSFSGCKNKIKNKQAGANMEELMKNPELMAEAQRQMQAMMGGAAAA